MTLKITWFVISFYLAFQMQGGEKTQWVHTHKRKIKKRRGRDGGREEDCWCPVCRAITHQKSPPSPPPWKNKTVSWHGGGGELQGGKLGNQMWSIKTYWHAEGLPLPHSHTKSTNSYSSPTCMCHTKAVRTTHTHTSMPSRVQRRKNGPSQATMCVQSVMQNYISKNNASDMNVSEISEQK